MDRQDAEAIGNDRGQGIGAFIEIYDDFEKYQEEALEAEENSRQYSDFGFITRDINAEEFPEELWEAYEDGVLNGIKEAWCRRSPDMRRSDTTW